MKKLFSRLALAAVVLAAGVQSLKAQIYVENFRYRAEAGVVSSKVSEFGVGEPFYGFRVSGQVLMPFENSKWALLTGLTLTNKGENQKFYVKRDQDVTISETTRTALMYLQMPLNISHRFDLNRNNRIYLEFGPYIAMGLGGKIKNFGRQGNDVSVFEKIDGQTPFSRFEVGIGASLHYDYKNVYLKGGAEYSLTNVINKESSALRGAYTGKTSRFGLLYLTLGYQF